METFTLQTAQFNRLVDLLETAIIVNSIGFIAISLFIGFLCRDKDL